MMQRRWLIVAQVLFRTQRLNSGRGLRKMLVCVGTSWRYCLRSEKRFSSGLWRSCPSCC